MAFDLREIDEIIEIVESLPPEPDTGCLRLLRQLQSGSENPDMNVSDSTRDAQYELYLGTILRRANIHAIHGTPDLTAEWSGTRYHIEAKRPASANRVDDRLRSAVHQIRRLPALASSRFR